MALIPQRHAPARGPASQRILPATLGASLKRLAVEKLPSGQGTDLAVRDSNTGFTFFNIQGHQYHYDAAAQSLAITNGRLRFKRVCPSARSPVGGWRSRRNNFHRSGNATRRDYSRCQWPTPVSSLPPMQHAVTPNTPVLVPGPDVIVGDLESVEQPQGAVNGNFVGLGVGTVRVTTATSQLTGTHSKYPAPCYSTKSVTA